MLEGKNNKVRIQIQLIFAILLSLFVCNLYAYAANEVRFVEICPGVIADSSGSIDASLKIMDCLNRLPANGGKLLLPPGTYLIQYRININLPNITIATAGLENSELFCHQTQCARLLASPTFDDGMAMLYSDANALGISLNHLIIDGNRLNRSHSYINSNTCVQGVPNGVRGRNAVLLNTTNSKISYSQFVNAACGTALALALLPSTNVNIYKNVFSDNGEHEVAGTWSDGLTVGEISHSNISENYFYNNTDVALILGGGVSTTIVNNHIIQTYQNIFAGLMLTNWSIGAEQGHWADFRGAVIENNFILCNSLCDIGMQFGVLPWGGQSRVAELRLMGAQVLHNTVISNKQMINVAGAGTPDFPIKITDNYFIRPSGDFLLAGYSKKIRTSNFNIENPWNHSFVDIGGQQIEISTHEWGQSF